MEFEKYTERARGFVQAAQTAALRAGHQQLVPLHILEALLADEDGMASNMISATGGDAARARRGLAIEMAKLPSVEGPGAGQVYLGPDTARLFEQAEQVAR